MKICTVNTPVGIVNAIDNDCFSSQLKDFGKYAEQSVIDDYLRPYIESSKTILDIGGHIGYHTLAYKKINNNVKVHTFEPQKELFDLLNKNILINDIKDVFTYNLAVGHENKKITLGDTISDGPNANTVFNYDSDTIFNLGGVSIGFGTKEVDMIYLDSMDFQDVDYIKVDVEGAETLVFFGAKELISRCKPTICFEYNHKKLSKEFLQHIGKVDLESPIDMLKSIGYNNFKEIPYENIIATV
jgi:FkbM family methyltransferase